MKNEMNSHLRLALPDDLDVTIWAYYSILCLSPAVMEDFLTVILSILIIAKIFQKDPYRVYNLLDFHPELKVQFSNVLKGST